MLRVYSQSGTRDPLFLMLVIVHTAEFNSIIFQVKVVLVVVFRMTFRYFQLKKKNVYPEHMYKEGRLRIILQSSFRNLSSMPTGHSPATTILLLVPWKLLVNVYSHGCISTQTLIGNKCLAAGEEARSVRKCNVHYRPVVAECGPPSS